MYYNATAISDRKRIWCLTHVNVGHHTNIFDYIQLTFFLHIFGIVRVNVGAGVPLVSVSHAVTLHFQSVGPTWISSDSGF